MRVCFRFDTDGTVRLSVPMSRPAELVDRTVGAGPSPSPGESRQLPSSSSSQLDSSLQHFSDPSFDPVDYLNDTLPPLSVNVPPTQTQTQTQQSSPNDRTATSLADLTTQAQSLSSQLSAQNARLSNTLTQFTDEIVRGGGRLAYEVEVLRGETVGLSEAVTETLHDDVRRFVPQGLPEPHDGPARKQQAVQNKDTDTESTEASPTKEPAAGNGGGGDADVNDGERGDEHDPEYIKRLRTLSLVKSRLDEVVRIFGEAMEWPLPPSEVSIASSFISVSAPEHEMGDQDREEQGREASRKLRAEVSDLLDSEGGGEAGLAAASRRVEALRTLANVFKGTAEERTRAKFVDGLAKLVEDRRRALETQAREKEAKELRRGVDSPARKGTPRSSSRSRDDRPGAQESGGGGLFRNLQRLREEIYLD